MSPERSRSQVQNTQTTRIATHATNSHSVAASGRAIRSGRTPHAAACEIRRARTAPTPA